MPNSLHTQGYRVEIGRVWVPLPNNKIVQVLVHSRCVLQKLDVYVQVRKRAHIRDIPASIFQLAGPLGGGGGGGGILASETNAQQL